MITTHVRYFAGKLRFSIDLQTQDASGRKRVTYKVRIARMLRHKWKKMGLSSLAELCVEKVWKTMVWAVCNGEVFVLRASRSVRTTTWWRNRSAWCMKWGPLNVTCWKHKWGFHNRDVTWDTLMAKWAGSDEDWIQT